MRYFITRPENTRCYLVEVKENDCDILIFHNMYAEYRDWYIEIKASTAFAIIKAFGSYLATAKFPDGKNITYKYMKLYESTRPN